MKQRPSLLMRIASIVVRRRDSLPRWVSHLVESVAKSPNSLFSRLVSHALVHSTAPPPPTEPLTTEIRVYIGPTNYSGQGWRWARAIEELDPTIGARNLSIEIPGTFEFPADSSVPVVTQNVSRAWQEAEFEAVCTFTHVLIEAERSLFGPLFEWKPSAERYQLEQRGISLAYIAHGTDIRSPRKHAELTRWSPFDSTIDKALQDDADRNIAFLREANRPVFVSTPDLLHDVPWATWCPVAVEVHLWRSERLLLSNGTPLVAHAPTDQKFKGTTLIEPELKNLIAEGTVEYKRIEGVRSSQMPEAIANCDILLDQFRIGSYGVAAVEAMAAGRVVVGHVVSSVRDFIYESTGRRLPIVEATADTIEQIIRDLATDPDRMRQLGRAGVEYSTAVHSGSLSARTLIDGWIKS